MYVCDIHMVDRELRMFMATVGATPFMTGKTQDPRMLYVQYVMQQSLLQPQGCMCNSIYRDSKTWTWCTTAVYTKLIHCISTGPL